MMGSEVSGLQQALHFSQSRVQSLLKPIKVIEMHPSVILPRESDDRIYLRERKSPGMAGLAQIMTLICLQGGHSLSCKIFKLN